MVSLRGRLQGIFRKDAEQAARERHSRLVRDLLAEVRGERRKPQVYANDDRPASVRALEAIRNYVFTHYDPSKPEKERDALRLPSGYFRRDRSSMALAALTEFFYNFAEIKHKMRGWTTSGNKIEANFPEIVLPLNDYYRWRRNSAFIYGEICDKRTRDQMRRIYRQGKDSQVKEELKRGGELVEQILVDPEYGQLFRKLKPEDFGFIDSTAMRHFNPEPSGKELDFTDLFLTDLGTMYHYARTPKTLLKMREVIDKKHHALQTQLREEQRNAIDDGELARVLGRIRQAHADYQDERRKLSENPTYKKFYEEEPFAAARIAQSKQTAESRFEDWISFVKGAGATNGIRRPKFALTAAAALLLGAGVGGTLTRTIDLSQKNAEVRRLQSAGEAERTAQADLLARVIHYPALAPFLKRLSTSDREDFKAAMLDSGTSTPTFWVARAGPRATAGGFNALFSGFKKFERTHPWLASRIGRPAAVSFYFEAVTSQTVNPLEQGLRRLQDEKRISSDEARKLNDGLLAHREELGGNPNVREIRSAPVNPDTAPPGLPRFEAGGQSAWATHQSFLRFLNRDKPSREYASIIGRNNLVMYFETMDGFMPDPNGYSLTYLHGSFNDFLRKIPKSAVADAGIERLWTIYAKSMLTTRNPVRLPNGVVRKNLFNSYMDTVRRDPKLTKADVEKVVQALAETRRASENPANVEAVLAKYGIRGQGRILETVRKAR